MGRYAKGYERAWFSCKKIEKMKIFSEISKKPFFAQKSAKLPKLPIIFKMLSKNQIKTLYITAFWGSSYK